MEFKIKYFKDYVPFHVGDEHHPIELNPRECPAVESEEAEVRRALENPIDSPKLREIVHPGEKIVIVTSDVTRPMRPGRTGKSRRRRQGCHCCFRTWLSQKADRGRNETPCWRRCVQPRQMH